MTNLFIHTPYLFALLVCSHILSLLLNHPDMQYSLIMVSHLELGVNYPGRFESTPKGFGRVPRECVTV